MNEKFKWIFLYGGLGWGIPFACLLSVIRETQDKPIAFGSFPIFVAVCIFAGMIFGFLMTQLSKNAQRRTF